HTREFLILDDNEFAFLTKEGARIERDGKNIARKPMRISWTPEMARKEGYDYFTLKEIHEQPRTITDTLMDEKSIDEVAEFARRFSRIEVVACGTSYHAGMVFKHLVQKFARIPCETIIASEYKYAPVTDSKTLVLAISQSGETADTLTAVKEAKGRGARVLALVNVLGSSLSREADRVFYTHAGPEISVVSTKAFTSQLAALAHVAFELADKKEMIEHLRTIPNVVEEVLKNENEIKELARKLKEKNDFFFIGRGISHPTAMEGALKLKEISYSHAEAYPGGELKHGPLSLLEKGVPVVAIAPNDETKPKMLGNIKECKARSALLIALSDSDEILNEADLKIKMPSNIAPELTPIVYTIPLQLLAYHIATMRGLDPDKPRNLAKSVTVE
ncbi:MAG: glutamine--fructose-6-phosphate transaminase (isomerizing), partial [Candidatus Micrarchaeota archaeon]